MFVNWKSLIYDLIFILLLFDTAFYYVGCVCSSNVCQSESEYIHHNHHIMMETYVRVCVYVCLVIKEDNLWEIVCKTMIEACFCHVLEKVCGIV